MRLRWLVSARVDLARIVDEIAIDNPVAADAFQMRLFKMVGHLTTFPDAGRTGRVAGTRELIVPEHPYVIVYRTTVEAVEVLKVLHGARQWPPQEV